MIGYLILKARKVLKWLRWFMMDIACVHIQDQILEALRAEYLRRPGYPSELKGSNALIDASYKEGKTLKYYDAKNRSAFSHQHKSRFL